MMDKRKSGGYLTVEATISLTVFLFFMMSIMNMGQIYRAQAYVTHGMLQSGKLLAYNSYEYDEVTAAGAILDVAESILNVVSSAWGAGWFANDNIVKLYWNAGLYNLAVKEVFGYCAGENPSVTEAALKEHGLSKGIDTIQFTAKKEDGNLLIQAQYQIELKFAFFGIRNITLHQQVKCGLWSKS